MLILKYPCKITSFSCIYISINLYKQPFIILNIISKLFEEKMLSIKVAVLIILLVLAAGKAINKIANSDFSALKLKNASYINLQKIPQWTCNKICSIFECNFFLNNCTKNMIDLDSVDKYEMISQEVTLKGKPCTLQVKYMLPIYNNLNKTLLVYFNDQLVIGFLTNMASISNRKIYNKTIEVETKVGVNNISVTMNGSTPDGYGFLLRQVSLYEEQDEMNSIQPLLVNVFQNPLLLGIINLPGYRVMWSSFLMLFVNLDRFELYIFHDRNYSDYSLSFIKKINYLKNMEDQMIKEFYNLVWPNLTVYVDNQVKKLAFKNQHFDIQSVTIAKKRMFDLQENYEDGFVNNLGDFFTYSLPLIFLVFVLMAQIFDCFKTYSVSKILKKFTFWGILLVMLFEGNIQSFAFYLTGEMVTLFFFTFYNKVINQFAILFFYFIILFATTSFVSFHFHYKRQMKYFLENSKINRNGIFSSTIDRGIICLLFGIAHRLFLKAPNMQILALGAVQIVWIFTRLSFLRKNTYEFRVLAIVWIFQGISRLIFQVTFFLYDNNEQMRFFLNEFHFYLIVAYLSLMMFEIFIGIFALLCQLKAFVKNLCRNNAVNQQQNPNEENGLQKEVIDNKQEKNLKNQIKNNNLKALQAKSPGRQIKIKQKSGNKQKSSEQKGVSSKQKKKNYNYQQILEIAEKKKNNEKIIQKTYQLIQKNPICHQKNESKSPMKSINADNKERQIFITCKKPKTKNNTGQTKRVGFLKQ